MKRFTKILCLIIAIIMVASSMVAVASAASAYQTYTYSIGGTPLYSPDAYSAEQALIYTDMNLPMDLKNPKDMITDKDGNIYIADTKNNRIIVCDSQFKPFMFLDSFVNTEGVYDSLLAPSGVYVKEEFIYVADTDNY